jgi:hypothetical protein
MPASFHAVLRVALVIAIITAGVAEETHTHAASPITVGTVTFAISCSKQAQSHIERGLAMFHSFLFDDAESQFNMAADMDASCAMAYWAQVIGLYRPLAYLPATHRQPASGTEGCGDCLGRAPGLAADRSTICRTLYSGMISIALIEG